MDEKEFLAKRFEENRARLRAVAHRILGSPGEADDAVQEVWLRLSRSGAEGVENLGGWLTTVVARVCLNMLRARRRAERREEPLDAPRDSTHALAPRADREEADEPEREALLADSVGLALLVVLETLSPAERLAFVLHDTFDVPFEEIAPIVGRSPEAARQLASRARRRVRGTATVPETDLARQREAVEAFLAAAREGDFDALLSVLDPNVVLRADYAAVLATAGREVHGATAVADEVLAFSRLAGANLFARPILVNEAIGMVVLRDRERLSVVCYTVARGKIVAMDVLADPERLRRLDLAVPGGLRPALRPHGVRRGPTARHLTRGWVPSPVARWVPQL